MVEQVLWGLDIVNRGHNMSPIKSSIPFPFIPKSYVSRLYYRI